MKWLTIMIITSSILIFSSAENPERQGQSDKVKFMMTQDTSFNMDEAIAAINDKIKGRENDPAETVFENIQIMKGFPAGRVPLIMKMAFSNSLGVDCTHCHNPDNWANDDKSEKLITRQMWKMVGEINSNLLANIPDLKGPQPVVNCTTCHRGDIKPALNLSN